MDTHQVNCIIAQIMAPHKRSEVCPQMLQSSDQYVYQQTLFCNEGNHRQRRGHSAKAWMKMRKQNSTGKQAVAA